MLAVDGQSVTTPVMTSTERAVVSKFRWRVLLPIVTLIVLSSLDRVNVSFAALRMNADLGLTQQAYSYAVGSFFVGYLLFQFPSTALLQRIGARRWIAACVITWGIAAAAMAFVRNAPELYATRFALGVAEAGFAPGVVYYCSGWMPLRHRANTIAVTMLAVPISVIIGGPLCGWLMTVVNPLELSGWRWMLLIEGVLTVAFGTIAYALFVDGPSQAKWLSNAERDWIDTQLAHDQSVPAPQRSPLASVLSDARCWFAAGIWCSTLIGANGFIFWLPQIVKDMLNEGSNLGELGIGVIAAVPWLGVGLGMWFNSRHSDKTQERRAHVGVPLGIAAFALVAAASVPPGFLSLVLLFITGLGLGSAQGVFWSIPTSFLHRSAAAAGITLINLVGNVGSLVGPIAIGWIRTHSTAFAAPVWFVAGVMAIGTLLLGLLYARRS
jgi:ACS family tartrate transporter-like MFS transporter